MDGIAMPDTLISETSHKSHPLHEFYEAFCQTGPDTLGGKYLRQFWHAIAVSADLEPGTAKPAAGPF
jgi:hypothetical protein